ncbi:xanthine dehydrogenase family protein molybdopterin-binding subunit [Streptomyces sp. NPDC050504]|uniref:xanthine dehydrogenase family protein molybdopterin-binding subunit n=1 Tax=Streptomyces sp. NPDC050504 TaxID=3365618 RepID=UPI0037979DD0
MSDRTGTSDRTGMSDRTGTSGTIAPAPADTPAPAPADGGQRSGRFVGRPLDRVDGPAKAAGTVRYTADLPAPGAAEGRPLAHAALVHSTVARARITALRTDEAEAVPGVVAVLTHRNAPVLRVPAPGCLTSDEVHWNGEPVAVVVAETPEAAHHAASLVGATYRELPATTDFTAEAHHLPEVVPPAAATVDRVYTTPYLNHHAIEPHATTAAWDGDRLTVLDTTQNVHGTRAHLARAFGVPASGVRVSAPFVGGGFGGKIRVWPGTVLAVLAARATGRPVRLALTREAVTRTVGCRSATRQRLALTAGPDGRLTSLRHWGTGYLPRTGGDEEQTVSPSRHLYAAPDLALTQRSVTLDLVPNTYMRAPGEAPGSFALESAVDELARELDLDPVELRLVNEPLTNPDDGREFSHRRVAECLWRGAELFGWADARRPRPDPGGRWLTGTGCAVAYHPSWRFDARLTVRLHADGTVLVRCGFHELGMGAATAQAQIAADELGVDVTAVRIEYGDTALPTGPGAGGSAQTATVAGALLRACAKLRRRMPVPPGRPYVEASVGCGTGPLGLAERAADRAAGLARRLRERRRAVMRAASGAHFCEVRVDRDTGEVRVVRWSGTYDVGTVVNAKLAGSQLRGGIVMGIGMALSEETLVDPRNGRVVNPGLDGYRVPVHADVPDIEVAFLDDPDPTMPLGVLGAGELGVTGAAAAVANAVYDATGRRVRELPITPEKVWGP